MLEADTISLARRESSAADPQIGEVRAARLTPRGKSIIVLDRYAPHVRVFSLTGKRILAFGMTGDGPGELRNPLYLALSGDSVAAVLHSGGFSEFHLNGEFIGSKPGGRPGMSGPGRPYGLWPYGLGSYCDTAWVLLASSRRTKKVTGPNAWLHLIPRLEAHSPGEALRTRAIFEDTIVRNVWARHNTTVTYNDDRVVFVHRDGDPARIYQFSCADGDITEIPGVPVIPSPYTVVEGPGGRVQERYSGRILYYGVGLLGDGVLVAYSDVGNQRTLTWIDGERTVTTVIPGRYILQDARPGVGAVFSAADPYPRIIFIPEEALLNGLDSELAGSGQPK